MRREVTFVALLLALFGVCETAKPAKKKAEKKPTGSQKCEKGSFGSLVKDSTIPLCDAHFPDEKAKSDWLVLFYSKEKEPPNIQETMNRVATDLGNEPPEKSKNLKKPKKQRTRIKDLAEKYEFEAHIPKKGLEEKGKDALLKVGAVCCDCDASGEQEVCKTRGMGIRILRSGKETEMPGSESLEFDAERLVKWVMGELGFVKGQAPSGETEAAPDPEEDKTTREDKKEDKKDDKTEDKKADKKDKPADLKAKVEELKTKKAKATEDEDFKLAGKIKKEIEALEKKIKKAEL
jgi:hypothetical protein